MAAKSNAKLAINCDMGESFGLYRWATTRVDAARSPSPTSRAGFMRRTPSSHGRTVQLAKQQRSKSAPIRRCRTSGLRPPRDENSPRRTERTASIYQVGALNGFLRPKEWNCTISSRTARSTAWPRESEEWQRRSADAAEVFGVPVFGMVGTLHEKRVSRARAWLRRRNIMPIWITPMMAA